MLTGTAFSRCNTNSMIYTGVAVKEWGLLNYVNKKIILFDRVTGADVESSILPANTSTSQLFRFSYANNLVWLYNPVINSWNSYNIWLGSALPIQWIEFTAICNKDEIKVQWKTSIEQNNNYFEFEKSTDDLYFKTIHTHFSKGDYISEQDYFYNDIQPTVGENYYRIKQVDLDNKFTYSSVIHVNSLSNLTQILIYP